MIANNDPNYQQDSNSPHTKSLARRTLRLVVAEVMFYEQNELVSIKQVKLLLFVVEL